MEPAIIIYYYCDSNLASGRCRGVRVLLLQPRTPARVGYIDYIQYTNESISIWYSQRELYGALYYNAMMGGFRSFGKRFLTWQ